MSRVDRRTLLAGAAGLAAAHIVGGCASSSEVAEATLTPLRTMPPPAPRRAPSIAVLSAEYATSPTTKLAVDAFLRAAELAGYEAVLTEADNTVATAVQIRELADRALPVDAIVIAGGDPTALGTGIRTATDAAIPVIGLGMSSPEGLTVNVTSDERFLGTASAGALAYVVGGQGVSVGIISYDLLPPIRQRALAARALMRAQGIVMVEDIQGDPYDAEGSARRTTLEWLRRYRPGTINGIFAAWDAAALGAYEATQEADRQDVYIVGIDGQDFARAAIREGRTWIATARQDWAAIGERAVEAVADALAGTPAQNPTIAVEGELLTRDTV